MELESPWVLWQNTSDESNVQSWGSDLVEVGEASSVPQFLYMVDEMKKIGVENLSSMRLFRKGVKPMWEDEANVNGGRLIVDIPVFSKTNIDTIWANTMAFCISNEIDDICGCVCNEKSPVYKISIWIGNEQSHEKVLKKWQEKLGLEKASIYFCSHKKSLDITKSRKKWHSKRQ
jgi:translation initiation factor 4E